MKRHAIVAFLLASFYSGLAQQLTDPNAVVLPSVNNKFFVSNTSYNVSLYTGSNSVSIPICELTSKSLNIPVSLSYIGSRGIKVQDAANYVGLGWQLNAGGQITRIVRGLPDDQNHGYAGPNASGPQIAAAAAAGTTDEQFLGSIGSGQIDGEPDLYSVITPFFSFQFVLDENGNPVFPNNTGYKITHDFTFDRGWQITDDQGNQYFFSTIEVSTTDIFDKSTDFTSTWYLDKIVAFNNSDEIDFSYISGTEYTTKHYAKSRVKKAGYGVGDNDSEEKDITSSVTFLPAYLSKITTAMGEVNFTYQFDRRDLTGAAKLTNIALYPYDAATSAKGNALKRYEFNYSYFGDPSSDPEALRLKLDYINLYGNATTVTETPIKMKSFYYETSTNLPARNSVEFDYWGYYNVNPSGTTLIPEAVKTPNLERTKANVLTKVVDASGENLEFQYELNNYYDASLGNTMVGGLRIKQVSKTLPAGENIYTQYIYESDNGNSTGQIYNLNYNVLSREVFHHITFCEINGQWGFCGLTTADVTISENIYHTYDLDGVFVGYSAVKVVSQNGGYELNNFYNFSDWPDVNTNITAYQIGSPSSLSYKRGLLTHKETHTAAGYKLSETDYVYSSLEQTIAKKSYGITPIPTYADDVSLANYYFPHYNDYATNIENYVLSQTIAQTYDQNDPTLSRKSITSYTYAANKRLVHQSATTDSKGNARVKTFYYCEDANIPYITGDEQSAINSLVQANKTSTLIHSVESNYGNEFNTHYSYLNFVNPFPAPKNEVLLTAKKTFTGNNIANASVEQYLHDINNSKLTSIKKIGGPFLSTLYGYKDAYMKAKVSNAVNYTAVSYVPGVKTESLAIEWPNQSKVINFTVQVPGDVELALYSPVEGTGGSKMEYSLTGPATYSGWLCNSNNNDCGTFASVVDFYGLAAGNYTLSLNALNYGDDNYLTQTITGTFTYPGINTSAPATNEFFYDGFEEYTGGNISTATPFAGRRYYQGAYTVPFVIPNSRTYQVDYHYLLNGQWYAASKPFQNNMVLSDGSAVDEVRVYPTDAQMVTYTYDPLIGITSECDARNRFAFYEYDSFGRLKLVRNNDKNIVQRYDYGYQTSLTQTCPKPAIYDIAFPFSNSMDVSYIVPPGCTGISYSLVQNSTGTTITSGTAGRIGTPISLSVPAGNQAYTVTITSYSADCSQGVSDTKVINLP
jgi:hypothetical protein